MEPAPSGILQQKKELLAFLALTFAATYLLELYGIAVYGSGIFASKVMAVPMFIPAISAIVCMVLFRSAALTKEAKILLALFLVTAAVMIAEGIAGPFLGMFGPFPVLVVVVSLATLLAVIVLNLKGTGRERLAAARLTVGRNYRYFIAIPVTFSALFTGGLLVSHFLGLSLPTKEYSIGIFASSLGVLLASVFITWPSYFGEEYGWRYYLQDRMFSVRGRYQGVLLIGLIWGVWHLPLMVMGLNFPGVPLLAGNLVYLLYTVIMSVIFGFAVIVTGSIWVAVILHALTDSIVNTAYPYIANGNTLAGIFPVLLLLGIFALVILWSRIWRNESGAGTDSL